MILFQAVIPSGGESLSVFERIVSPNRSRGIWPEFTMDVKYASRLVNPQWISLFRLK